MIPPPNGEGFAIRSALRLVGLVGFLVSASILTGTWVGIKLDQALETQGIVTALGILLGLFIGLGLAGWFLLRETHRHRP